jgi:hypothetical protein
MYCRSNQDKVLEAPLKACTRSGAVNPSGS